MVGFGSSLRMGRRTGWESAYLDYETLKLLLSQIEAVYEERDLGAGASADGFFVSMGSERNLNNNNNNGSNDALNTNNGNGGNNKNNKMDYRDELFLESDSDIAFASEVNVNDVSSDDYDDRDFDPDRAMMDDSFEYNYTGATVWEQQGLGQHHMHVDPFQPRKVPSGSESSSQPHRLQQTPAAFSVSAYGTTRNNERYSSSSEEDDIYYAPPWGSAKKKKKKKKKDRSSKKATSLISTIIGSNKKKKKTQHHRQNFHQKSSSNSIPDAFIVQKGRSGSDYGDDSNHDGSDSGDKNYYYYNFGGNDNGGGGNRWSALGGLLSGSAEGNKESTNEKVDESSSLLTGDRPSTPTREGNFVSFPSPTPRRGDSGNVGGSSDGYGSLFSPSNPNTPSRGAGTATNSGKTTKDVKKDERKLRYERERRRERKQRRRRRLLHKRREREKKVPPHIRIAHEKSRAITERFLGLLRAEVEKVTLFAQARLGELADTAGSLRFLSSDETMETSAMNTDTYDYPLSDGGIHPSASSSSDEGAGGYHNPNSKGGFPWSDSSSEDNGGSKSSGGERLDIAKTFSSTEARGNASKRSPAEPATFATAKVEEAASKESRRVPGRPGFKETQEKFEATKRKIAQFQEVRRDRSIFQRNDYIVGEDLLLISAVDEADAFSAVGVELLHILKYICVNLIAVRKICKKHDRLLMNRMLGGYYHRKRTTRSQEDTTLGGLIAHVAGDIYEAHPDLIGLVNNGKLIGIYDLKIQQLANSRTVKVVSSCLALALSEYEVSRWRADALAKLNPPLKKGRRPPPGLNDPGNNTWLFNIRTDNCLKNSPQQHEEALALLQDHDIYIGSDDEHGGGGPPSTTSSLSLSRLRYAVLSIAALREASRIKSNHFSNYLGRSSLAFTGHAIIGEGLDGCSRETLDFLLSYNPDAPLLLDTCAIYEGLRCGQWRKASIASVMTSALAVGLTLPQSRHSTGPLSISPRAVHAKEMIVSNALGILPPKSEGMVQRSPLEGTGLPPSIFLQISRFTDVPASVLRANRFSLFLYNANYFIAHPTSLTLVLDSDDSIAYSALIIGAPVLSAIIISMIHCRLLSGYATRKESNKENVNVFRYLLIFSCLNGIVGNVVQLYGIEHDSIALSIFGRFLLGFSAAEIVNRQFVVCFLPACLIVAESARLVHFQVSGQVLGLLIGSTAGSFITTGAELNLGFMYPQPVPPIEMKDLKSQDAVSGSDIGANQIGRLTAPNWLMVALWVLYLIYVLIGWTVLDKTFDTQEEGTSEEDNGELAVDTNGGSSSSESSASDGETGHARLFHSSATLREIGALSETDTSLMPDSPNNSHGGIGVRSPKRRRFRQIRTFSKNIRKLMRYSIAIPVSLVLIMCTVFAQEVLLSSCALITKSYFHWKGSVTGLFLASLSAMLLPMDYCCEQVTRRYEERCLVKRSIVLLVLGLLVMVNWGSLFALIPNINNLLKEDRSNRHHQYDWMLGVGQYVVGFVITFTALRALGIGSRSLLSKVSPPNLQNVVVNLGTIGTFIGLFSQLFADFYIASIVLSQREINIDILNSLLMPISIAILLMYYLVRKHYFFLM